MEWAALIAWLLTIGGGTVLLGIWIRGRGHDQERHAGLRIRPSVLGSHLGLGTTGALVWIAYLASRVKELVWVAFDIAAIASLLGTSMFVIWLKQHAEGQRGAAEHHFPIPIVAVHGVLATATLALTLVAALQA